MRLLLTSAFFICIMPAACQGGARHTPVPTNFQYSLTVERQFMTQWTASVGYVGNLGRNMLYPHDINAVPLSELSAYLAQGMARGLDIPHQGKGQASVRPNQGLGLQIVFLPNRDADEIPRLQPVIELARVGRSRICDGNPRGRRRAGRGAGGKPRGGRQGGLVD